MNKTNKYQIKVEKIRYEDKIGNTYIYHCPICNKEVKPNDYFNSICAPEAKFTWSCLSKKCVNMAIFQVM